MSLFLTKLQYFLFYLLQVRSGEELSAREESALANMTLAEAEEGRRQLMRMRALQSYQADKLKRQNKIKSKKYRKLLRKSREKVREGGEVTKLQGVPRFGGLLAGTSIFSGMGFIYIKQNLPHGHIPL